MTEPIKKHSPHGSLTGESNAQASEDRRRDDEQRAHNMSQFKEFKASVLYSDALVCLRQQFELNGWEEDEDKRSSDSLAFVARLFGISEDQVMKDLEAR